MSKTGTYKALIIRPEESPIETVHISYAGSLRALQTEVGGYIEAVYGWTRHPDSTMPDVTFFLNEEGKIHDLPVNVAATALWWALCPDAVGVDHLRGVVVVTGGADGNGDTLSVPEKVVEMVNRAGRT